MKKSLMLSVLLVIVQLVFTSDCAYSAILFSEDFEIYAEGSNLFGQGGWVVSGTPPSPLVGTTTLVGIGSGLGTSVSNGRLNPGTGVFGMVRQPFGPPVCEVYTLSFDAYAYSDEPPSRISALGFQIGQVSLVWEINDGGTIPGSPLGQHAWRFSVDNITGNMLDNEEFLGGLDKPVEFEIIVDAGLKEFYGRYNFGSGFNVNPSPLSRQKY